MTWAPTYTPSQRKAAAKARKKRIANQRPPRTLVNAVMGGTTAAPAPKTQPWRSPTLLAMAERRPCLLLVPGICNHRIDTTVACHSNLSIHGKAGARKADDCYSVWGCAACHYWLDFGRAAADQREQVFMLAHANQVLAWRLVAMDQGEPERFRRAARSALARLGAEPP